MMTVHMWIVVAILVAAIVLFVTEWMRVDVVALTVVATLMLTEVLTPAEALSGFSNPAVLTIAALFVVGAAILQTGLAARLGRRLLRLAGTSQARLTAVLMVAVALFSSFVSSTGTVAVLLPVAAMLSRTSRISPSRLMIPMAYAALMGGALTLIGTPSNLIVSNLLRESGLQPFGFFSFTPVGLVLVALGTGFMLVAGQRLLPDLRPRVARQEVETPEALINQYRLPDNLFRLRVRRASDLVGKSLAEANLRHDFQVSVLEIERARPPGLV
jgi:di/tricarboxylate transporter